MTMIGMCTMSTACDHWLPQSKIGRRLSLAVIIVFLCAGTIWHGISEMTIAPRERDTMKFANITTSINFTTVGIPDFPTRHGKLFPRNQWSKLDNQTCVPEDLPAIPSNWSLERRMPYAIVIGSMKSGTSALSVYLYKHPNVVAPAHKEIHFFDFQYEHFTSEDGIHRRETRSRYRKAFNHTLGPKGISRLQDDASLVAIDDSPRYIFWSDRVPARILCTASWAKILAILRNPIDRAYSQYNMQLTSVKAKRMKRRPTFEEWIAMDMDLLKQTGVIQDTVPLVDFAGSVEEMEAWKTYTRIGKHAPLGRGLYAMQLRQWFQAYEAAGKSRSDFFIIESDRMRTDKNVVYAEVLDFLGLEPYELETDVLPNSGKYKAPMSNKTREILEDFYRPYNQELYKLLGKEWEGVWDP